MFRVLTLVVSFTFALVGCSDDEEVGGRDTVSDATTETSADSAADGDDGSAVETRVTATEGGVVEGFGATLVIPAGALGSDETLTLTEVEPVTGEEDEAVVGTILDFGPDNLFFAEPVQLTMPAPAQVPAGQTAVISWRGQPGDGWVDLPTTVEDGRVQAELEHFSQYAVRVIGRFEVGGDDLAVLETCDYTPCGGSPLGDWTLTGLCSAQTLEAAGCAAVSAKSLGLGDGLLEVTSAELKIAVDSDSESRVTIPSSCTQFTSCGEVAPTCTGNQASGCVCELEGVVAEQTSSYTVDGNNLRVDGEDLGFCVRDERGRKRLRLTVGSQNFEFTRTLARVKSFSVDHYGGCALREDDSLVCWGDNEWGQRAVPAGGDFVAVSVGWWHNCALERDGEITCWGNQSYGRANPPPGRYKQLDSGGFLHRCALRTDDSVACWGDFWFGGPPSGTDFAHVTGGHFHNCALKKDQTIVCWGNNYAGATLAPAGSFRAVNAGGYQTCAIGVDGRLVCWGGRDTALLAPPQGDDFSALTCGGDHCCALRGLGELACWGRISTPPPGNFVEVHSGLDHACARRENGTLICWGSNNYGQCELP